MFGSTQEMTPARWDEQERWYKGQGQNPHQPFWQDRGDAGACPPPVRRTPRPMARETMPPSPLDRSRFDALCAGLEELRRTARSKEDALSAELTLKEDEARVAWELAQAHTMCGRDDEAQAAETQAKEAESRAGELRHRIGRGKALFEESAKRIPDHPLQVQTRNILAEAEDLRGQAEEAYRPIAARIEELKAAYEAEVKNAEALIRDIQGIMARAGHFAGKFTSTPSELRPFWLRADSKEFKVRKPVW